MQAIVCELCGSNDLLKQDGVFVCQHCGTKYTLEEARKLMGTVSIQGTVETRSADFLIEAGVLISYHGASTHVEVPDGVRKIGPRVFSGMPIETVSLPASCTSYALNAFSNCSQLQGFTVDAGNPSFAADDQGCLWSKDFSTLHIIPPSVILVTLKPASQIGFFPQNAQCGLYGSSIGASIFRDESTCYMRVTPNGYLCGAGEILMGAGGKILAPKSEGVKCGITTILFPRGVTTIGSNFSGFPFLETVVLPETLELLDRWALSDCPRLTNIDLNGITRLKVGQNALAGSTPANAITAAVRASFQRASDTVRSGHCALCGGTLKVLGKNKVGLLKTVPYEWKCESCGITMYETERAAIASGDISTERLQSLCGLEEDVDVEL